VWSQAWSGEGSFYTTLSKELLLTTKVNLPYGTRVRIVNEENNLSTIAIVYNNDPLLDCIANVSSSVAANIKMNGIGTTSIRLEVLTRGDTVKMPDIVDINTSSLIPTTGKAIVYESKSYENFARHSTLPFNTRIKVTNVQNSRSIIIPVNGKKTNIDDSILELSHGAASYLSMLNEGESIVEIQVMPSYGNMLIIPTIGDNPIINIETESNKINDTIQQYASNNYTISRFQEQLPETYRASIPPEKMIFGSYYYVFTSEIFYDKTKNEVHEQMWLYNMQTETLIVTDEMVYGGKETGDDIREDIIKFILSHS
jgi:rare lipoprotein A (peptidoglycan hydrolase)